MKSGTLRDLASTYTHPNTKQCVGGDCDSISGKTYEQLMTSVQSQTVSAARYQGNGASTRNFNLGFEPSVIFFIIDSGDGKFYAYHTDFFCVGRGVTKTAYQGAGGSSQYISSQIEITSTGFQIESSEEPDEIPFNASGSNYYYIAIH